MVTSTRRRSASVLARMRRHSNPESEGLDHHHQGRTVSGRHSPPSPPHLAIDRRLRSSSLPPTHLEGAPLLGSHADATGDGLALVASSADFAALRQTLDTDSTHTISLPALLHHLVLAHSPTLLAAEVAVMRVFLGSLPWVEDLAERASDNPLAA